MWLLAAVGVVTFLIIVHLYRISTHINNFPSPPGNVILGNALEFLDATKVLDKIKEHCLKHGFLRVSIGPVKPCLLLMDPKAIQYFMYRRVLQKGAFYRFLKRWLGNGLLTGNGRQWRMHRKALSPCFFQKNILEGVVDTFENLGDVLIQRMQKYEPGKIFDIHPILKLFSLEAISETALGVSVSGLEHRNKKYIDSIEEISQIIFIRTTSIWKKFDIFYKFTNDYKAEKEAIRTIDSFVDRIIDERMEKKTKGLLELSENSRKTFSLIDMLLLTTVDGEQLSRTDIRDEINTFTFAGFDTTAAAMSFTIYALSSQPEVQEKVLKEQIDIFGPDLQNIRATYEDLQKMKYLEMVIKESLRLYPPVPIIARKLETDIQYDGEIFAKGLNISLFIYACHRNPKYFPEPEKFFPERFERAENIPCTFNPFGVGLRNCIGQKYAMLEMKSCISKILRSYELNVKDPKEKLQLLPHTVLTAMNGFQISYTERKNVEHRC